MSSRAQKTISEAREARSELFYKWWIDLKNDPADRANLRRASTVNEVQLLPVFHKLRLALESASLGGNRDALAAVAAVLAQIDEDTPAKKEGNFADMMSETRGGDSAQVSGLRFRRLLQVEEPDERLIAFGRVVRHCQRKAPVGSLGNDLLFWSDPVRKRWAYRYYERAQKED